MTYSHPISAPIMIVKGKKKVQKSKKKEPKRKNYAPSITKGNFNQFY